MVKTTEQTEPAKQKKTTSDKTFKQIAISTDLKVKIVFTEKIIHALEDGENVNRTTERKYTVNSNDKPHSDLLDSMKKLRKHALAIIDLAVDSKKLTNYTVSAFSINGSIDDRKSRVVMTLEKFTKGRKKTTKIPVHETAMYDPDQYADCEEMSSLILVAIEEIWKYVGGKYQETNQIPLFER